MARTELELINYAHTDAEYKAEIEFPKSDDLKRAPTLHHLVVILGVVQDVSPKYNPIKASRNRCRNHEAEAHSTKQENCYFMASIVQEALQDLFDGKSREAGGTSWAEEQAPKAREDVLSRLYWHA